MTSLESYLKDKLDTDLIRDPPDFLDVFLLHQLQQIGSGALRPLAHVRSNTSATIGIQIGVTSDLRELAGELVSLTKQGGVPDL